MRSITRLFMLPLLAGSLALGACTAEVEEEGQLPDVDVQGGQMPEVDVDPANVDVTTSTDTTQVVTPDVDVDVN